MIEFNSISKQVTLLRITLLSAIFFSGGVHYFSIFINTLIPTLLIIALYLRRKIGISGLMSPAIFILLLYLAYAIAIAEDYEDITYIGYRSVRFLMAFLLINYFAIKKVNLLNELFIVLSWVTIHGIMNFFVINFLFQYFNPIPDTGNSNLLIFFRADRELIYFQRNQGLFWEPGVFQIFLNIFLFINLFFIEKKFPIWVVVAVILSTLSTAGLVISFLQISYYYLFYKKINFRKVLTILLISPILFGYFLIVKNNVENKLIGSSRGSFLSRSFDTENGFTVAMNNPFGIGFSTEKYQDIADSNDYNIFSLIDTDRGNTNSIATLFYSTGIIWGVIFMIFMYKQKIFPRHKLLIFGMLFICLSSEPLFFSAFFLLFPISGMLKVSLNFINPSQAIYPCKAKDIILNAPKRFHIRNAKR